MLAAGLGNSSDSQSAQLRKHQTNLIKWCSSHSCLFAVSFYFFFLSFSWRSFDYLIRLILCRFYQRIYMLIESIFTCTVVLANAFFFFKCLTVQSVIGIRNFCFFHPIQTQHYRWIRFPTKSEYPVLDDSEQFVILFFFSPHIVARRNKKEKDFSRNKIFQTIRVFCIQFYLHTV